MIIMIRFLSYYLAVSQLLCIFASADGRKESVKNYEEDIIIIFPICEHTNVRYGTDNLWGFDSGTIDE